MQSERIIEESIAYLVKHRFSFSLLESIPSDSPPVKEAQRLFLQWECVGAESSLLWSDVLRNSELHLDLRVMLGDSPSPANFKKT